MIKKLAILVIEKADGSCTTKVGEKGDISAEARALIRAANDNPGHDNERITALGEAGVLKSRKWKGAAASAAPTTLVPEPEPESTDGDEEETEGADADAIRALLKEKGVRVPPRISLDNLIKMAQEHGIEA